MTVCEAAAGYLARGWVPVPIAPARKGNDKTGKAPRDKGWQQLAPTAAQLGAMFRGRHNVGLILGEASDGLVDVDLDCPEAIALADLFLPPTRMRHGRGGNETHRWYRCADDTQTRHDFKLSELQADGKRKAGTLVELRSGSRAKGHQTVVPPSTHYTGANLEWSEPGPPAPAELAHAALLEAVGRLALACALVRSGFEQDKAVELASASPLDWAAVPKAVTTSARRWRWPHLPPKAKNRRAFNRPQPSQSAGVAGPVTAAVVEAVTVDACLGLLGLGGLDERGRTTCPVHDGGNETSFSAGWHAELWKCFSCDAAGNVVHLAAWVRGTTPREARRWLAEAAGLDWRAILEEQATAAELAAVPVDAAYSVTRPCAVPLVELRRRTIEEVGNHTPDVLRLDTRTAGSGKSTDTGYAIAAAWGSGRGPAEWRPSLSGISGKEGKPARLAIAAGSHRLHDEEWAAILARGCAMFEAAPVIAKTPPFACALPDPGARKAATERYHAVRAAGFNPVRVVCAGCPHMPDANGLSRRSTLTCGYQLDARVAWEADIVLCQHRHLSTSLERASSWLVDEDPGDALDPEAILSRGRLAPFAELVAEALSGFEVELLERCERPDLANLGIGAAASVLAIVDALGVALDRGPATAGEVAAELRWVELRATSGVLNLEGRRALAGAMHRLIRDQPARAVPQNYLDLCAAIARCWARGEPAAAVWRRPESGAPELVVPVAVRVPEGTALRVLDATASAEYWTRRASRRVEVTTGGKLMDGKVVQVTNRTWSRSKPHTEELAYAIATWCRRYSCASVGVVFYQTHIEELLERVAAILRGWRCRVVELRSLYWGHLRGSNRFAGCDAVFVCGTPMPGDGAVALRALTMGATGEDLATPLSWGSRRVRQADGRGAVVQQALYENPIMQAALLSVVNAEHTQGVARGTRGTLPPRGLVVFSSRPCFTAAEVTRTTLADECLTPEWSKRLRRAARAARNAEAERGHFGWRSCAAFFRTTEHAARRLMRCFEATKRRRDGAGA